MSFGLQNTDFPTKHVSGVARPGWASLAIRAEQAVAALALLVLAPLLLIIGLAIVLESSGPVLFRQTRTGIGGRTFKVYKFRTMRVLENGASVRQATPDDPRVTTVGRFLRRRSLDELPQLLNVLRGEMSFVGPRPHAVAHDSYYSQHIAEYYRRFEVRPGITGWAQVNGARGATPEIDTMRRRVDLDLWYIRNASPLLYVWVLWKTVEVVLFRRDGVF